MTFSERIEAQGIVTHGFQNGYERKGVWPVWAVLNHLGEEQVDFGGDKISVVSLRYQTFADNLSCVRCGVKGWYFAKERSATFVKKDQAWRVINGNRWHFNLYGTTADGREVLLTKDHILPRSKGGEDDRKNMQTMCSPCNGKKGNKLETPPLVEVPCPVEATTAADFLGVLESPPL